jgi:hypothetical protein
MSSVRKCPAIDQPTTRRLKASRTTATYRKPCHVGTYVMSATHRASGQLALNIRSTRSGAGTASWSRTVVRVERRRCTPSRPATRMSRATRFREQ